jgi:chemotaxis protein CheD
MATETMVRMGEFAVATEAGDVLTSIGLGSCIGLVLVDRARATMGLAHVMLPERPASAPPHLQPGKFADSAVPALIDALVARGARRVRLEAFLVGGAQMFTFGGGSMDVGARNDAAVRAGLAAARLPIRAAETGGDRGRTVRVYGGECRVTVKAAGSPEMPISGAPAASARRLAA